MQSFLSSGIKYGCLRIKDDNYIGSKWIKRNRDWARINYSVMVSYSIYCIYIYIFIKLLLLIKFILDDHVYR